MVGTGREGSLERRWIDLELDYRVCIDDGTGESVPSQVSTQRRPRAWHVLQLILVKRGPMLGEMGHIVVRVLSARWEK